MRRAIFASVASLTPHFFQITAQMAGFPEKKITEHKMCVSIFSTSFVTFLVLRRTERDVIKNVHWSSCGVSNFNDTLIFWSFEKYANIKFRENPDSGSRVVPCVRTDRQTDMTTLTVAFRNFANAPKKAARKCSGISPRQSTTPP